MGNKRAELNDRFRRTFEGGLVLTTHGFMGLPRDVQRKIIKAVKGFDSFTESNDPYGEHDFGAVTVQGEKCFWKIDYYDPKLKHHSPDPDNPGKTKRVLTIMLADEY